MPSGTIFKYDEVIDILVSPLSDFRALKRLRRNTAKQSHWNNTVNTLSDVWQSLVWSNCSPPAFNVFNHSLKLLTALLIGSGGRLFQITCNASLSLVIDLGFGWSLWQASIIMVVHGSGASGGNWSFLINSGSWPEAMPVRYACLSLTAVVERGKIKL